MKQMNRSNLRSSRQCSPAMNQTNPIQTRRQSLRKRFLSCRLKTEYTGLPNWLLPQELISPDQNLSMPLLCPALDPYLASTLHSKDKHLARLNVLNNNIRLILKRIPDHKAQVRTADTCIDNVKTKATTEMELETLSESVLTLENTSKSISDLCMTKGKKVSFQPSKTTKIGQRIYTLKEIKEEIEKVKARFTHLNIVRQCIRECENEFRQLRNNHSPYAILESKIISATAAMEELKQYELQHPESLEYLDNITAGHYIISKNSSNDEFTFDMTMPLEEVEE